jgi:CxxC motif-containing protein
MAIEGQSCGRIAVAQKDPFKRQGMDCVRYLKRHKVKPPLSIGQVVVEDILGTGEAVVACAPLQ